MLKKEETPPQRNKLLPLGIAAVCLSAVYIGARQCFKPSIPPIEAEIFIPTRLLNRVELYDVKDGVVYKMAAKGTAQRDEVDPEGFNAKLLSVAQKIPDNGAVLLKDPYDARSPNPALGWTRSYKGSVLIFVLAGRQTKEDIDALSHCRPIDEKSEVHV